MFCSWNEREYISMSTCKLKRRFLAMPRSVASESEFLEQKCNNFASSPSPSMRQGVPVYLTTLLIHFEGLGSGKAANAALDWRYAGHPKRERSVT